jgi:hypothetical protein
MLPSGLQVPPAGICDTIRLSRSNEEDIPYRSEAKASKGKNSEECETHNVGSLRIEAMELVQRRSCRIVIVDEQSGHSYTWGSAI